MQPKRILPKIFLTVGFIAVFLLFKYQAVLKKLVQFNINKAGVYSDNFLKEAGSAPKRLMPFVTTDKEAELKLSLGAPFIDFSGGDWREFWNIIYGVFPLDPPDASGLPQRLRQLTPEEVSSELIKLYPEAFSNFKEGDWKGFFETIFRQ